MSLIALGLLSIRVLQRPLAVRVLIALRLGRTTRNLKMSKSDTLSALVDREVKISCRRQAALKVFGDKLDKHGNVSGTPYYFDNLWRLRFRDESKTPQKGDYDNGCE